MEIKFNVEQGPDNSLVEYNVCLTSKDSRDSGKLEADLAQIPILLQDEKLGNFIREKIWYHLGALYQRNLNGGFDNLDFFEYNWQILIERKGETLVKMMFCLDPIGMKQLIMDSSKSKNWQDL